MGVREGERESSQRSCWLLTGRNADGNGSSHEGLAHLELVMVGLTEGKEIQTRCLSLLSGP